MNIYFDIETGPLPIAELQATLPPFDDSKHPELPPFDEDAVKLGALKDAKKIAAKKQEARLKHAQAVLEREQKLSAARQDHEHKHIERAALHASTGQVLMVAIRRAGENVALVADEPELLATWWGSATAHHHRGARFVGFNIFHFDLPFLIRRSWKHGVAVPPWVRSGRYWSESFVDLLDTYQMGNRQEFVSLDAFDRFLGGKGKSESGAGFWMKWQAERDVAIAYALRDVELLEAIARRVGVDDYRLGSDEALARQRQGAGGAGEGAGGRGAA